jgi:hypothetical protein
MYVCIVLNHSHQILSSMKKLILLAVIAASITSCDTTSRDYFQARVIDNKAGKMFVKVQNLQNIEFTFGDTIRIEKYILGYRLAQPTSDSTIQVIVSANIN